jgi:hypothetical protein
MEMNATKVRVCPYCNKNNSENAFNCTNCGTTLSIKTIKTLSYGDNVRTYVKPIVEEDFVHRISQVYEDDLFEILNPVRQNKEDVIWGCDVRFRFKNFDSSGFIILSSQRLICVNFVDKPPSSVDGLLKILDKVFGIFGIIFNPTSAVINFVIRLFSPQPNVSLPRGSRDRVKEAIRKVRVHELRDLVSTKLYVSRHGLPQFGTVNVYFMKGGEIMLTFQYPQDASKVNQLLQSYRNSDSTHQERVEANELWGLSTPEGIPSPNGTDYLIGTPPDLF